MDQSELLTMSRWDVECQMDELDRIGFPRT